MATLAADVLGTPTGFISFVDTDRQCFKAHIGIDVTETPREVSFCAHAINNPGELLVVPDTAKDPRFANNPLVVGAPFIGFYAGVPLVDPTGMVLGTLCVVDTVPHEVTPKQLDMLKALGRQVISQLELRQVAQQVSERCRDLEVLETIVTATSSGVMIVDLDNVITYANRSFTELTGFDTGDAMGQCPREASVRPGVGP